MEAVVKEGVRHTRLLVHQHMGEARAEILDHVLLTEEGAVLRH